MAAKKTPAFRLGIDLGGTKIHAVVIDRKGRIVGTARTNTKPHKGYEAVVKRIAEIAEEALDEAGIKARDVRVVGLGAPGPVEVEHGVILMAPNLGWSNKPLAADLRARLRQKVVLGNDVNFGALGEVAYGAAQDASSAYAAFVGTGLGGALVINGEVVNGAHGYCGEIGHLPAPFGDAICGCGRHGCLETVASKSGVVRQINEAQQRGQKVLLDTKDTVKASAIATAMADGCAATRLAMDRLVEALAWGLATIGNTVDPEVFVLGGGMAAILGRRLAPQLSERMAELAVLYRRHKPRLLMAKLGDDAVAIGAAVAAGRALR